MVLLHNGPVVYTKLFSQLSYSHHKAIGSLWSSISLICSCRRSIGVIDLQVILHVLHSKERKSLGTGVHRNCKCMVTIRACIGLYFHEYGCNGSILLSTHLHMDSHWMTGAVGIEFLSSGVSVVDTLSCNPCCVGCKVLHKNILLTSISSAYPGLDYMDLVFWNLADPAYNSSYMVGHLGRCMDHKSSAFHCGVAYMWFKRSVLDLAGLIGLLHYGVSFSKAFFHISDSALV